MTDRELMQQALEALEDAANILTSPMFGDAAAALRTAIEAAEKQEPVAWLYLDAWGTLKLSQIMPPPTGAFPVYTAPPAQPAKQEPVAWLGLKPSDMPDGDDPMYDHDFFLKGMAWADAILRKKNATPPAAQRQPLTEEQLKPIADEYRILFGGWVVDFARAIEAAHGIGEKT